MHFSKHEMYLILKALRKPTFLDVGHLKRHWFVEVKNFRNMTYTGNFKTLLHYSFLPGKINIILSILEKLRQKKGNCRAIKTEKNVGEQTISSLFPILLYISTESPVPLGWTTMTLHKLWLQQKFHCFLLTWPVNFINQLSIRYFFIHLLCCLSRLAVALHTTRLIPQSVSEWRFFRLSTPQTLSLELKNHSAIYPTNLHEKKINRGLLVSQNFWVIGLLK